jgi:hypothetical protein
LTRSTDENGLSGFKKTIDGLRNAYLWFPTFDRLNDPAEMASAKVVSLPNTYSLGLSFLLGDEKYGEEYKRVSENRANYFSKGILDKEKSGVCCFSESYSHQAMWAYYADNFRGICLEFDTNILLSANDFCWGNKFSQIRYSTERKIYAKDSLSIDLRQEDIAILTKSPDWEHEKEWRIFKKDSSGKTYYKKNAIILGARISKQDEDYIKSLAKEMSVSIMKSSFHDHVLRFADVFTPEPVSYKVDLPENDLHNRTLNNLKSETSLTNDSLLEAVATAKSYPHICGLGGLLYDEKNQVLKIVISVRLGNGEEAVSMLYFPIVGNVVQANYEYSLDKLDFSA